MEKRIDYRRRMTEQRKRRRNATFKVASALGVAFGISAVMGVTQTHAEEWVANTPASIQVKQGDSAYTMVKGDTLWAIATKINVNVETLASINGVDLQAGDQYSLQIGRVIKFDGQTIQVVDEEGNAVNNGVTVDDTNKIVKDKAVGEDVSDEVNTGVASDSDVVGTPVTPNETPAQNGGSTVTTPTTPSNNGGSTGSGTSTTPDNGKGSEGTGNGGTTTPSKPNEGETTDPSDNGGSETTDPTNPNEGETTDPNEGGTTTPTDPDTDNGGSETADPEQDVTVQKDVMDGYNVLFVGMFTKVEDGAAWFDAHKDMYPEADGYHLSWNTDHTAFLMIIQVSPVEIVDPTNPDEGGEATQPEDKAQPVTVLYVDQDGTSILAPEQLTGKVGEDVSVTAPEIEGYTLDGSATQSATISEEGQTITFTYIKDKEVEPEKVGKSVNVLYVDDYGTPIAEATELTGKYGETVTATAKDIEGWVLSGEATQTATISEEVQTIVFSYVREGSETTDPTDEEFYVGQILFQKGGFKTADEADDYMHSIEDQWFEFQFAHNISVNPSWAGSDADGYTVKVTVDKINVN